MGNSRVYGRIYRYLIWSLFIILWLVRSFDDYSNDYKWQIQGKVVEVQANPCSVSWGETISTEGDCNYLISLKKSDGAIKVLENNKFFIGWRSAIQKGQTCKLTVRALNSSPHPDIIKMDCYPPPS